MKRSAGGRESLFDMLKWSLLMVLLTLGVAAVAIPLLRWLGFGPA